MPWQVLQTDTVIWELMLICLILWCCNNLKMSRCNLLASQDYWFLSIINASAPLSCSVYRDLNPSLCFLCESPLNQACIINVCSDLPTLSKCNQYQGTHTTCSYSFVPMLFALAHGCSSFLRLCLEIKGTGQVEDIEDALPDQSPNGESRVLVRRIRRPDEEHMADQSCVK